METTNEAWATSLQPMMEAFDESQHVLGAILVELPQPTNKTVRPDRCTAVMNATGHMCRRAARGGPMMHNGGRYELELVRLPKLESKGENPWRVSVHRHIPVWEDGNQDVMKPLEGGGH